MNFQRLSNQEKKSDSFILFLTNTHFTTKEEKYIRTQWGFECYFSNFSSQARGVAILFNNTFEFKVLKTVRDESGN